ncbi:MAG: DNA-directed RNA polymerase subunit beta' [Oscillospiraceae bacterium]|jgi:DNA-directed RNA polymerase subunit beta'|nr:DNA-directed RNA polymerase subunit beta' [Oscillospiraceae bacterium]
MEHTTFESIRIGLASPEQIRAWSFGEVKKPETINYRTLKPERDGLFCERIFGPTKDWECHCGKYKRMRYKDKICERCGVKVTKAKVRRERMGHIELAAPVSHIWYFKGIPSRMGLILDISPRNLEKVLYFSMYIVTDPGDTPLVKGQTLDEKTYLEYRMRYEQDFKAGMGAEAIKLLLSDIDLESMEAQLREEFETATGQKRAKWLKRLEVVTAFRQSSNRPEWMVLDVIPVIPPEIRPMVQLDGGRFATSDLNDLYRRVINRNNRLQKLLELGAPEIIVRNEKRMLQESVDALIDNGRRGRPVTGANNRAFKSLSDMLKGKQGRFRQNLLGKRVDYSGRSVIVVGPELKIHQCGLPKEMALELFKPFVMKRLVETEKAGNVKTARKMVERSHPDVWDALEVVIYDHPVMLNRAPTLHRLGIQAFEPILVEGRAIKLHPLVCTAFNADFDGDQMAVHVPLSAEAQTEARVLMLAANNLLKPSDGRPVAVPTQDMVLGSYYMTYIRAGAKGEGKVFSNIAEAQMAYDHGDLDLHAKVRIRMFREVNGRKTSRIIETSLGRVTFNEPIPQDLGFTKRETPEDQFLLEIDCLVNKSMLGKIIDRCIRVHGTSKAAMVLDDVKSQGYKFSTRSGITVAVSDATIPPLKAQLIAETEARIETITQHYTRGFFSNAERAERTISAWEDCTHRVADALRENFDEYNPINMMLRSGARGTDSQLRQLAGMRGLIANTAGKTIEIPIRANYREGLNVLEYFISSRGARKGLADTALRTADSGYLTRRLVDVSQDVIIREYDCGCTEGSEVYDIFADGRRVVTLEERLTGRYLLHDLRDTAGKLVHSKDELIGDDSAAVIANYVRANTPEGRRAQVIIRSLLTCESERGVCIKCYGGNLATGEPVTVGEAVGIIAAQSIGEPGTQLTMRTFHTGGAKDSGDITQGLPRVEELFEARKPKLLAQISETDGIVSFRDIKKSKNIIVTSLDSENPDERAYPIPYDQIIKVTDGKMVYKGDNLTEGARNPHDILAILGVHDVHHYLIQEVQRTYRTQGVDISDKHIEVIIRQMMRKVKITEPGDSKLLPGAVIEKRELRRANEELIAAYGENANLIQTIPVLMGITKASLATDSFLSAASFQETTRVLTDAAIKGKSDPLIGLKENVIIGKLLPSGTGMRCYTDVAAVSTQGHFGRTLIDAISGE